MKRSLGAGLWAIGLIGWAGCSSSTPEDSTPQGLQIYDLSTGAVLTDAIPGTRHNHQAVLLDDGRVLVSGGWAAPSSMVEIYAPSAAAGSRWSP